MTFSDVFFFLLLLLCPRLIVYYTSKCVSLVLFIKRTFDEENERTTLSFASTWTRKTLCRCPSLVLTSAVVWGSSLVVVEASSSICHRVHWPFPLAGDTVMASSSSFFLLLHMSSEAKKTGYKCRTFFLILYQLLLLCSGSYSRSLRTSSSTRRGKKCCDLLERSRRTAFASSSSSSSRHHDYLCSFIHRRKKKSEMKRRRRRREKHDSNSTMVIVVAASVDGRATRNNIADVDACTLPSICSVLSTSEKPHATAACIAEKIGPTREREKDAEKEHGYAETTGPFISRRARRRKYEEKNGNIVFPLTISSRRRAVDSDLLDHFRALTSTGSFPTRHCSQRRQSRFNMCHIRCVR